MMRGISRNFQKESCFVRGLNGLRFACETQELRNNPVRRVRRISRGIQKKYNIFIGLIDIRFACETPTARRGQEAFVPQRGHPRQIRCERKTAWPASA